MILSILIAAATPEAAQSAFSGLSAAGIGMGQRTVSFFDLVCT